MSLFTFCNESLVEAWIHLSGEHRNLDALPEEYAPKVGCLLCGSAWVEIDAVCVEHFLEPRLDSWTVSTSAVIRSARILCCIGHSLVVFMRRETDPAILRLARAILLPPRQGVRAKPPLGLGASGLGFFA